MIVLVACEARQVEHDHEMYAALVQPAIREQVLELAAVGGFGALAFLVEAFEDLVALAAAVLLARAELGQQTQVLRLFLSIASTSSTRSLASRPSRNKIKARSGGVGRTASNVFVAGSRQISRLPAEVRTRLDTVIERGLQILVADTNGADKAVQRFLADGPAICPRGGCPDHRPSTDRSPPVRQTQLRAVVYREETPSPGPMTPRV